MSLQPDWTTIIETGDETIDSHEFMHRHCIIYVYIHVDPWFVFGISLSLYFRKKNVLFGVWILFSQHELWMLTLFGIFTIQMGFHLFFSLQVKSYTCVCKFVNRTCSLRLYWKYCLVFLWKMNEQVMMEWAKIDLRSFFLFSPSTLS